MSASTERKHADTMARRRISKTTEQWGVAQYGLLHRAAAEQVGMTREEAIAYCDDREWAMSTPIRRLVVTIDGVEFGSAWYRVPTDKQRIDHPTWPASVELS